MFEVQYYSTAQLQKIAIEQIERITSRQNPGNVRLAQDCLDEITVRESVAWPAGWAGPAPVVSQEEPVDPVRAALFVMVLDKTIHDYLKAHDPMALKQALDSLGLEVVDG